jgi:hypothetical protein
MEAFMKRDQLRDTVIAGVIAGVVIACGNGAAELIGEAIKDSGEALSDAGEMLKDAGRRLREDAGELLQDAGEALQDAGTHIVSDASDVLQDAGGKLLTDAGEILQDAGETTMDAGDAMLQDANAQSSCGNCDSNGFQQVLTADTDWNQIRGGTIQGDDWTRLYDSVDTPLEYMSWYFYKELTSGPFILTDVHGLNSTTTLFTVEQGNDCFEEDELPAPYTGIVTSWRIPTDSRTVAVASASTQIRGVRILIKSDETLCASATFGYGAGNNPDVSTSRRVHWSGFQPYQ